MKLLDYSFSTTIDFSVPVRDHYFVLRCMPSPSYTLRVLESDLTVEPEMRYVRQTDSFGNLVAIGRKSEEHTRIGYHSSGTVRVDFNWAQPDVAHPVFRHSTPLTRAEGALATFAESLGTVKNHHDVREVDGFCLHAMSSVHDAMAYAPGTTTVATTASEAFAAGRGVCQDFSHVLVTALRHAGIAARYVSGLALGEGQTHAWVEASVGDFWYGYDPTRNQAVDETYIPLAWGRDWSDCPVERGSFVGLADQTQTVHMTVKEHAEQ